MSTVEQMLLAEHSKKQKIAIAEWVGDDKKRMKQLMTCFFSKELRLCQRASWPLLDIHDKHPNLFDPYYAKMLKNLDAPLHDAIVRNTLRIFEDGIIPHDIEGTLLEKCFSYISNPKKAGAIRAFSVTVAYKICKQYPELLEELRAVLEEFLPFGAPAFKYRAKKIIGFINKDLS